MWGVDRIYIRKVVITHQPGQQVAFNYSPKPATVAYVYQVMSWESKSTSTQGPPLPRNKDLFKGLLRDDGG